MKCRYLRGVPWTMSSETLKSRSFVRKFSIKLLGGLFFPSTFDRSWGGGGRGLKREGGDSEMYQREQGFSRTDLWLPGAIPLFLTIRKW